MATTTLSSKFQIVIPQKVRERLHLVPRQRFHIIEKGRVISLVPETPLKSLKGFVKGMGTKGIREKKERL